jgi:hypothetical protein
MQKKELKETRHRTITNRTTNSNRTTEVTLVEGIGGPAGDKTKGSWIHVESMTALHCMHGNCVSWGDLAYPGTGNGLVDYPLPPQELVQIMARAGAIKQNRANITSSGNSTGPPDNATCDDNSPACLSWQQQVIGTCCRLGHHGTLCAYCDEGWAKAKELCIPCQSFDYPKLSLVLLFYLGLCLFFCRKATRLKKPGDVDENGQSSFIGIMTFFLQTVLLPPLLSDPSRHRLAIYEKLI